MTAEPTGIHGLQGRESVGACLTIGVKGRSGAPVDKDRFFVTWPVAVERTFTTRSGKTYKSDARDLHPHFSSFNTADAKHRKIVKGQIVHASLGDCFRYQLKCQTAKGRPSHPGRLPYCVGDGQTARRFDPQAPDGFREIACLGEKCEFRSDSRGKAECGPNMRLLFRLQWKDGSNFPTPLAKYTSGSWNTIKNFVGMFDAIGTAAKSLGFTDYSLAGFRFSFMLVEKTSAKRKARFPVVHAIPETDPIDFLLAQVEQRKAIADRALVPLLECPAEDSVRLTDPEQSDPQVLAEDHASVHPGREVIDVEDIT